MTTADVRDERPTYGVKAQCPPPKLPPDDRKALIAYANAARWLYPGPVGAWIARDIELIAEFGYRFANTARLAELLAELDAQRGRREARVAEAARMAFRTSRPETASERRGASGGGTMPAATQTSASGESGASNAGCGCRDSESGGRP